MTNEIIVIRIESGVHMKARQRGMYNALQKAGFIPQYDGADIQVFVRNQGEANKISKLLVKWDAYVVNTHLPGARSFEKWLKSWA